jgi:hypothetical protein
MLGKFIAWDFIAIACEMRRFPASNENTGGDRRCEKNTISPTSYYHNRNTMGDYRTKHFSKFGLIGLAKQCCNLPFFTQ